MQYFIPALTLMFIGLKLTNFIDWSWWWVLSPIWGGFALAFLLFIVWFVLSLFVGTGAKNCKRSGR